MVRAGSLVSIVLFGVSALGPMNASANSVLSVEYPIYFEQRDFDMIGLANVINAFSNDRFEVVGELLKGRTLVRYVGDQRIVYEGEQAIAYLDGETFLGHGFFSNNNEWRNIGTKNGYGIRSVRLLSSINSDKMFFDAWFVPLNGGRIYSASFDVSGEDLTSFNLANKPLLRCRALQADSQGNWTEGVISYDICPIFSPLL